MPMTPLTTPPSRTDPTNFAARGDALLSALPTFVTEANALEANVVLKEASAVAQAATATSAASGAAASQTAAAASAGAIAWVSGTTYAIGDVRWSPANRLNYRRIVAGAGTTDPSADATNWTGVGAAQYGSLDVVAVAAGSADVITGSYLPAVATLTNGMVLYFKSGFANTTATPTFSPNGLTARAIVKGSGLALVAGDIPAAGYWVKLQYDSTLVKWVMLNPATGIGLEVSATSVNSGSLYGNRIINGAQEIDQVNGGAAVTPGAGTAYLTDMMGGATIGVASKLTFQQVADAPAGLKNSMKITVAAQYAPAATDQLSLLTAIEGGNILDFQFGAAGAVIITLSNWIKGSVAGTYAVAVRNSATNRSYVGTVTVTTSWAQVKVTLTGDTTGAWLTDTGVGLYLSFDLGSGSNFNTAAGSWQTGNFLRTAGSVTFVNQTAGATLNITGVDCRPGSVAPTVFERRMGELQLCQRYYYQRNAGEYAATGSFRFNTTTAEASFFHPVPMRVAPTITAASDVFGVYNPTGAPASNSFSVLTSSPVYGWISATIAAASTQGVGAMFIVATGRLMAISARLL